MATLVLVRSVSKRQGYCRAKLADLVCMIPQCIQKDVGFMRSLDPGESLCELLAVTADC